MEGNVFEDIMSMEPTEEKNVFKAFKLRQNFAKVSVFGGQLVSQCIVAACKTVDPLMECHNAQLNFLSGIVVNEPLKYKVLETRNGKSFATRMVG
uniref:PID domain-containing protein n=1 Tax=Rhabditophanes sp. KR3021 TaxID=114890 RepID=A0AC35U3B2_9BILA